MSEIMRIGVAGLGTVGVGTIKLLQENAALLSERAGKTFEVVAASARSEKDRGVDLSAVRFEADASAISQAEDIDIVVELIGGEDGIALEVVQSALSNGKHVVTANKALIAKHGTALTKLAEEKDVALCFEAAVAGGTPVLNMIRAGLTANHFSRVAGILNGTCNFMLTEMEKRGCDYPEMLAEADALGYLEADPRLDVEGIDTAHKLAILAALAFGKQPNMDGVICEGISRVTQQDIHHAGELGYRIKLLGVAEMQGDAVLQYVAPTLVPLSMPMASVDQSYNAVELHGDHVERIFLTGRGAGPGPTASAVVADLVAVARGDRTAAFSVHAQALEPLNPATLDALKGAYYLRLHVADKPGVLAQIAQIFADHGVSVEELRQHAQAQEECATIIVITHTVLEKEMQAALAKIEQLDSTQQEPMLMRIAEM